MKTQYYAAASLDGFFSREYSQIFNAPPLRDIINLRQTAVSGRI
jgi:hypothetical protein